MNMSYGVETLVETLGMPLSMMVALIFGGLLFLIAGSDINVKNENENEKKNKDPGNVVSYIDGELFPATNTTPSTNNDEDDVATGVPKTPFSPPWMTVSKKKKQRNHLASARASVKARNTLKKEVRGDRDQNNSNSYINDGGTSGTGTGTGGLRDTTNIDTTHDAVASSSSSSSTASFPTTSKSRRKNERAQARAYYEDEY